MSVAPLSTTMRMYDPSERKGALENSAGVAMNAPKNPEGKRWSGVDDCEEAGAGAAGVVADAPEGGWEGEDDEATSAKEAPRALNEKPNVVGSDGPGCATAGDGPCCATAGDECVR